MSELTFVPVSVFKRVREHPGEPLRTAALFADLCRMNVLSMIQAAGSGHAGSSLSCLDIVSWLYLHELRLPASPESFSQGLHDVFFSSKGHDAPAQYAVLTALGLLPESGLLRLRRLNGLPGHPDPGTSCIETSTGSLGMGISKAKGMVRASRLAGKHRRFYVLTGDGELQEGQIWESLASAARDQMGELTVLVDINRIQSDDWVEKVNPAGDLAARFRSFGWAVFETDGHDVAAFSAALAAGRENSRPKVILAQTVKGRGVSFMEGPAAMKKQERLYPFHSGALSAEDYSRALEELTQKTQRAAGDLGLGELLFESKPLPLRAGVSGPSLVQAYSKMIAAWGAYEKKLVVLDADLAKDCGLLEFEKAFPERFVECGIAEQDMVSQAGGLALQGYFPVVHSFAAFLTARANEQIFCNATEKKRILYVGTLAGLLPAPPGHSHQAVRDLALMASIPDLALIQPCCPQELEQALAWAIRENPGSTYLRLSQIPVSPQIRLPADYRLHPGRGTLLRSGSDALMVAYGPVMVAEALKAADLLEAQGLSLGVLNFPWLNQIDSGWLLETLQGIRKVFVVEDHALSGGLGERLAAALAENPQAVSLTRLGVEGVARSGQNEEVLKAHGLDGASLAARASGVRDRDLESCR